MKKIFYSLLAFTVPSLLAAQSPGGVSGNVLWLKADDGTATVSGWSDASGNGNNFSQPTSFYQPSLSGNVINQHPAFVFSGNQFMSCPAPNNLPTANSDRTAFIIASSTDVSGYHWAFVYGTVGNQSGTFQLGNHDGNLISAYYASPNDMSYSPAGGYWSAAQNAFGTLAEYTLSANTETLFDRGGQVASQATDGMLTAGSVNAVVGALNTAPNETWNGNIAEIIIFNSALSSAQRQQVESYLALKYGFTLGSNGAPVSYIASDGTTTYWTASPSFQNDVFGIGADAGNGFSQTISNSQNTSMGNGGGQSQKGNLLLNSSATPLTNLQFLMIGNDGGSLTEQTIGAGQGPAISEGSTRVGRNWKVQNTNGVGALDMSFDLSGLFYTGGTDPNNYRLMIDMDGDGDYTTGLQQFATPASITPNATNTGQQLNFTGITFNNNVVFTLITQGSTALLPATWKDFSVALQNGNNAMLHWETTGEINVDHYTVQYSTDGNNYTSFGTVAAKNGTGVNEYNFSQAGVPSGVRYYRVMLVDKDGATRLSTARNVHVAGFTGVMLRANPVITGNLVLDIDVTQNTQGIIRVFSNTGQVLRQTRVALSGNTTNTTTVNVYGLSKGSYHVQVQLGAQVFNKTFIRM